MNFTFYNRPDYFKQLARDIDAAKPGERILVASIVVDPEAEFVGEVFHALAGAAQRGAHVTVLVDAYTFLISYNKMPGPLWSGQKLSSDMRHPFGQIYQRLKHIEQLGGRVDITNRPVRRFGIMHGGRSHIKAGIIGDKLYIGGCNLNRPTHIDLMVGSQNAKATGWVYEQLMKVAATGSTGAAFHGQDQRFDIDTTTTLLLDAGKPRQSLILDEAYKLIDRAKKSLLVTCQYFPGGRTANRLLTAFKRGVDVRISYSHPSVHGLETPAHHLQQLYNRLRLPSTLTQHRIPKGMPKLHAKVLVSESEAIVGSHNFVTQGVTLGTAEIALHVKDPQFAKQLREFIETEISQSLATK